MARVLHLIHNNLELIMSQALHEKLRRLRCFSDRIAMPESFEPCEEFHNVTKQ
jgi:hypothetical protein